jgi:probable addiction module antidote protein
MALKTTPWDSAEYLKTEDDIAAYLEASFAEAPDDPAFLVQALGVVARARNMSQLARDTGLTREGLYKAFSAEGNPSFGTVLKVADAMGYQFALVSKASKARGKTSHRAVTVRAPVAKSKPGTSTARTRN